MNKLLVVSLSTLAAAAALTGCSDNNNNPAPTTSSSSSSSSGGSSSSSSSSGSSSSSSGSGSSSGGAAAIPAGTLLVARTNYAGTASTVTIGQALPGGGNAVADGGYPEVFENEVPDASFGVTSPIFIDQLNPSTGTATATLAIPTSAMSSSFSSKSELALNESLDGTAVTFMGYDAPINTLDVSNSNTSEAYDQTNPVASIWPRAVGQVSLSSSAVTVTPVNAYSGNNGRAAVLANGYYYMVGNAGNGSATAAGLCLLSQNTGVQFYQQGVADDGGDTFPVGGLVPTPATAGGCSATGYQYGYSLSQFLNTSGTTASTYDAAGFPSTTTGAQADDKTGKDDNFRGLTIYNNTLYTSKGSGSNGIDTVFQVGTAGALASGGVISDAAITVLPGFNTLSEKTNEKNKATPNGTYHPFGLWFANATTLFVADEGDGTLEGATGKITQYAGLEQWSYSSTSSLWTLVATYQNGLNINTGTVTATVTNPSPASGDPSTWNVYTDGLRNLTGKTNSDGSVTIYATTSTTSNDGTHDLGSDPNQVVTISIPAAQLALTSAPATAPTTAFTTVEQATAGQRLGGVLITH